MVALIQGLRAPFVQPFTPPFSLGLQTALQKAMKLSLSFLNNALDPRITFTRASSGTHFDSTGRLVTDGYNLLTYSQDFTSGNWVKTATTITASQPDPYGGTNASKATATATTTIHETRSTPPVPTVSAPYTHAIIVKDAGAGIAYLQVNEGGVIKASFVAIDLTTGTLGSVQVLVAGLTLTATVASLGSGWYIVALNHTITATCTALNQYFGPAGSLTDRTFAGDGQKGIFVYRAAFFEGTFTAAQILAFGGIPLTTTAANSGPRFDYDPVTLLPRGLLIEEQRVNYCLWSEDFSNAVWVKTSGSVTTNDNVAPTGTSIADTFTASAGNATMVQAITTTAVSWTFSVYLKRKTGTGNVDITMDGTTWVTQTINSSTWTRCIVTQTGVVGTSNCGIRLVTSGDAVYVFGGQAE